jgi:hypothetical protein
MVAAITREMHPAGEDRRPDDAGPDVRRLLRLPRRFL